MNLFILNAIGFLVCIELYEAASNVCYHNTISSRTTTKTTQKSFSTSTIKRENIFYTLSGKPNNITNTFTVRRNTTRTTPKTTPTTTPNSTSKPKSTTSQPKLLPPTPKPPVDLESLFHNESLLDQEIYNRYFNDTEKQSLIPPGLDPAIDMSKFNPLNLSPIQMSILQVLLIGTCYRDSFTRGAGSGVSYCNETTTDKDGSLCYPKCEEGYAGNGPVCWEKCKPGYTDRGAFCIIDLDIYNKGCCCAIDDECCNNCNATYIDDGCTCRRPPKSYSKKSYGRGAGEPLGCKPDEELNGLLCYPICRDGYGGNGPVCWKRCNPPLDTSCGALCAVNEPNCAVKTTQLLTVLGPPFQAFANLAGGIISITQIPNTYIVPPCLT